MTKTIIKAQMKQRIDTEDNWKAKNPVLLNGELGLISGDPRYKIGNGTTPWNDLPFRGVGIEEYDNRTLVQADGLVDTDDVHYFLPNANPMDKKHTFAMLSDIPEGGEGGEGGPSAEEIYIGEEEPTDPNVKVWINPKEQGEGGGSAGGSGALRVWINEMTGGENNSEQVAENAETFKAMWNETPQMAILCAAAGLGGFPMMMASPVVVYRLISENGEDMISMAYRDIIDQGNGLEIMETYVYLKQDGTVIIEY